MQSMHYISEFPDQTLIKANTFIFIFIYYNLFNMIDLGNIYLFHCNKYTLKAFTLEMYIPH